MTLAHKVIPWAVIAPLNDGFFITRKGNGYEQEIDQYVNRPLYVFVDDGHATPPVVSVIAYCRAIYSSAFTPGNTFPSKYSSNAPPPVDT